MRLMTGIVLALAVGQVACVTESKQPPEWTKTTVEGTVASMCVEVQYQTTPAKVAFDDPPDGDCVSLRWIGHDGEQIGSTLTLAVGGTFIGPPGSSHADMTTTRCPSQGLVQLPGLGGKVGVTGVHQRSGSFHSTKTASMPLIGEFLAGAPIRETVASIWAATPDGAFAKADAITAGEVLPIGVEEATRLEVVSAGAVNQAIVHLQSSAPLAAAEISLAGVVVPLPQPIPLGNGWWQVSVVVDDTIAPPSSEILVIWETADGVAATIEAVIID